MTRARDLRVLPPTPTKLHFAFHSGPVDTGDPSIVRLVRVPTRTLEMPSGRLVAADPFSDQLPDPFSRALPPGSYEVSITHAYLNEHWRSAFAVLTVSDALTVSWELLTRPGDLPVKGKPYRYIGYGVDAALGCFCDDVTARLHERRFKVDDEYREQTLVVNEMEPDDWGELHPAGPSSPNLIGFSTGAGDGRYATFGGLASDGSIASVVTDFRIIDILQ
jgi:Protein of unknown function (DUF4241)